MRGFTFMWLLVAALTGAALYLVSQQVQMAESRLAKLNRAIAKEEETIRVLSAEWSYLNTPERLAKLSKERLDLVPMDGSQIASIGDLPEMPEKPPEVADEVIADADKVEDAAPTVVAELPSLPGRKPRTPKSMNAVVSARPAGKPAAKPDNKPAPRDTKRDFDHLLATLTGER